MFNFHLRGSAAVDVPSYICYIMSKRVCSNAVRRFDAHLQKFNQNKAAPAPPALLHDDMDGLGRDRVPFGLSDPQPTPFWHL